MSFTPIQSEILSAVPGIIYGFGFADQAIPDSLLPHWELRPSWTQVHGTESSRIEKPNQECGNVDALFSEVMGTPISIKTADCVPILMVRRDGKMVSVIHAGWRGLRERIVKKVWDRLQLMGQKPGDWVACIGPAIGPCCYTVSEDLTQSFLDQFATAYESALFIPEKNVLDLPALAREELNALGFLDVELLRFCTSCSSKPSFFSHRRDRNVHRQFSGLMRV